MNLFFNEELISTIGDLRHTSGLDDPTSAARPVVEAQSRSLLTILASIAKDPASLVTLWNWKSALLSTMLRGPIFLVAAVRHGWEAALGALLAETLFCAGTAGFYGAIVQTVKDAEPQWLTGVLLAAVIPVLFQGLEYLLHWFRGTPHLRVAEIVSLFVSAISALFNWYAMRRGTLLVGDEGRSFGRDLLRLPILFFGFLAVLPRKAAARAKELSMRLLGGTWPDLFSGRQAHSGD